jgi:hypothetical protein
MVFASALQTVSKARLQDRKRTVPKSIVSPTPIELPLQSSPDSTWRLLFLPATANYEALPIPTNLPFPTSHPRPRSRLPARTVSSPISCTHPFQRTSKVSRVAASRGRSIAHNVRADKRDGTVRVDGYKHILETRVGGLQHQAQTDIWEKMSATW